MSFFSDHDEPEMPAPMDTPFGSVQPIRQGGSIAADMLETMRHMGAEPPYSAEDVAKIIHEVRIGASLRAEAGYGLGSIVILFHTRTQKLDTRRTLLTFLTANQLSGVDVLYWNIVLGASGADPISCASKEGLGKLLDFATACAGLSSTDIGATECWRAVPTDGEMREMESL
jgi:hypothetical protein